MPVEIKELVIRAVVSQASRPDQPASGGAPDCAVPCEGGQQGPERQDAVVAAAVREVLRILRSARER